MPITELELSKPDVDPDLARQLDAATSDEQVEAVLVLRRAAGAGRPPIDAAALMQQVSRQDGQAEMHYLPGLGAVVIRAHAQVIRALLSQPEIEIASANRIA